MFEKALITRIGDGAVDLGLLAETMLFYGSTHLLLNRPSVINLATRLPPDDLLAFLDRGEVRLSYLRPAYAVASSGPLSTFDFVAFSLHGHKGPINFREEIGQALEQTLGSSGSTRKLAREIGDRLTLHRFKGVPDGENVIVQLARGDITDQTFLHRAARAVLSNLLPGSAIPPSFRFGLVDTGKGYLIDTDLDFKSLNAVYHQRVPSHSTLSCDYVLSHVISARSESYFAAEYLAEVVTSPVHSQIMRLKHYDFLRARDKSAAHLEVFRDVVLPDFPSIRETINSGERTISEFLKLLDQAQQFRGWLQAANPDRELLASYLRAATQSTWADNLPTKGARFAIITGMGMAVDTLLPTGLGTAAGVGLGAADALLLDKFIKGWRPNHFIEGPYKSFVKAEAA